MFSVCCPDRVRNVIKKREGWDSAYIVAVVVLVEVEVGN